MKDTCSLYESKFNHIINRCSLTKKENKRYFDHEEENKPPNPLGRLSINFPSIIYKSVMPMMCVLFRSRISVSTTPIGRREATHRFRLPY